MKNSNDMTSLHSLFLKILKCTVLKNIVIMKRNVLDIIPLEVITRREVDPILCVNCHSRAFVKTLSRIGRSSHSAKVFVSTVSKVNILKNY